MRTTYIDKLIGSLNSAGCDAVLLCPSEELRFFAGFSPLMCERFQGLFLKKDGTMFYFCNLLTGDEVRDACKICGTDSAPGEENAGGDRIVTIKALIYQDDE